MARRDDKTNSDSGLTPDANDGDKSRDVEVPNAEAVREGKLSASQMGENNVEGTDVQWPPGRVDNGGTAALQDVPGTVIQKDAGIAVVQEDSMRDDTDGAEYAGTGGE